MSSVLEEIRDRILQLRQDAGMPERRITDAGLDTSRRWAAAVKCGSIYFYNTEKVHIGLRNIDWAGSHIHHQEWPAQLNRFFWLAHLANVWNADGDQEMPRLAYATIEDWIRQHPAYAADTAMAPGDNTLNLSIRLGQAGWGGWWNAAVEFVGTSAFDDEFVERMLKSTRGQIDYLHAHLSARGNWRISQLNCMLFCGLVLPGFEDCADFAARGLREAMHRQVEADGSHCEHTPGYHGWMARVATSLWRLGRARPELPLQIDSERLLRMWDYAVAAAAPNGAAAGLHDSGVWTEQPQTGHAETRQQILATSGLPAERVWDPQTQPSRWFPDAGQLYLRDGWDKSATFITFDATRWGGGHCHLSRLAVSLYAGGRMLLYDPGIFSYEMSDPFAAHGKSTAAHNTLQVDGRNQSPANPDASEVYLGQHFAVARSTYVGGYFTGRYHWSFVDGLGDCIPGSHSRTLLWVKGRYALVFDRLAVDRADCPFSAAWQLPAGEFGLDADHARVWTTGEQTNILVQCLTLGRELETAVHVGEEDPLRGWLPRDAHGGRRPAPQVSFQGRTDGPADLVTLLLPFCGTDAPRPKVLHLHCEETGARGIELKWAGGTVDTVVYMPGFNLMAGYCGPIRTDGTLAFVEKQGNDPVRALVYDGFGVCIDRHELIQQTAAGTYEWTT